MAGLKVYGIPKVQSLAGHPKALERCFLAVVKAIVRRMKSCFHCRELVPKLLIVFVSWALDGAKPCLLTLMVSDVELTVEQ